MKTKEELNALKEEVEALNGKLRQLIELPAHGFDFLFQGVQFLFCFHDFFSYSM